jgi:hypothetical protein
MARITISILCGSLVGLITAAILSFFMMQFSMVSMGSGINLISIFLLAPLVIMSALFIGLVLGAVAGFWIFAELSRPKKAEGKISE